eukprot:PhF_6_TR27907/c0_g1_i1/m.40946
MYFLQTPVFFFLILLFSCFCSLCIAQPTDIRFLSDSSQSAITSPGQGFTTFHLASPYIPIIVELISGDGSRYTVNDATFTVKATCGNVLLRSNQVSFSSGLASFSDLTFDGCVDDTNPCSLVFVASIPSYAADGKSLNGGPATVIPNENYDFVFSSTSGLQSQTNLVKDAVVNQAMQPSPLLQVLDSCGAFDTSLIGTTVTATVSSGTLAATSAVATITSGTAVFGNLMFTAAPLGGSVAVTFTAQSGSGLPFAGKSIMSAPVFVAATVTPKTGIRFKLTGSYFTVEGQGATVTLNSVLNVVVELLNSANAVDTSDNAIEISVTGTQMISGTTAVMKSGVATFTALKVIGCVVGPFKLTFTAGTQGNAPVQGKTLFTGNLTVQGSSKASIAFASTNSYVIAPSQTVVVFLGNVIPNIRILTLDGCGTPEAFTDGLLVSVSSSSGTLLGTTTVATVKGVANFTTLYYDVSPSTAATLTFSSLYGNLVTGSVVIRQGAQDIRFLSEITDSYIVNPNQPVSLTANMPPMIPIIIELLDGDGKVDTSTTTVVVTAKCGSMLIANNAQVVRSGWIMFDTLKFQVCGECPSLEFTATPPSGNPVDGKVLKTGKVTITAEPTFDMIFGSSSSITANKDVKMASVVVGTAMLPVVLMLVDSCGDYDTSFMGGIVRASASSGTLTGTTATISSGIVVFPFLTFTTNPTTTNVTITFTADDTIPFAIAGKTLTSAPFPVSSVVTPRNSMRFQSGGSVFTYAGQSAVVSSNISFRVVIEMLDSANKLDTSDSSTVITVTTNNGTLVGATSATMQNGVATFPDLMFLTCVPAKLTFTAGNQGGGGAVAGTSLITGDVTFAVAKGFSIRFPPNTVYGGNVTVKSMLPPIRVELMDSCGAVDRSSVLVAQARSDFVLAGITSILLTNGSAVFTDINFPSWQVGPTVTIRVTNPSGANLSLQAFSQSLTTAPYVLQNATIPPTPPPTNATTTKPPPTTSGSPTVAPINTTTQPPSPTSSGVTSSPNSTVPSNATDGPTTSPPTTKTNAPNTTTVPTSTPSSSTTVPNATTTSPPKTTSPPPSTPTTSKPTSPPPPTLPGPPTAPLTMPPIETHPPDTPEPTPPPAPTPPPSSLLPTKGPLGAANLTDANPSSGKGATYAAMAVGGCIALLIIGKLVHVYYSRYIDVNEVGNEKAKFADHSVEMHHLEHAEKEAEKDDHHDHHDHHNGHHHDDTASHGNGNHTAHLEAKSAAVMKTPIQFDDDLLGVPSPPHHHTPHTLHRAHTAHEKSSHHDRSSHHRRTLDEVEESLLGNASADPQHTSVHLGDGGNNHHHHRPKSPTSRLHHKRSNSGAETFSLESSSPHGMTDEEIRKRLDEFGI